jgi:hypothetical protein
MLAYETHERARALVHRTRGLTRGPITRLVSPSDRGEHIKPFVFLDLASFEAGDPRIPMARFRIERELRGNGTLEDSSRRAP